jgi:hypothetical protein
VPWCENCEELNSELGILAEQTKSKNDFVVATFDASLNEHELVHF